MNKLIKELAKQAEFSENELHIQGDNFQKFADLIVWECMKICEDVMKKNNSALDCWSQIKGKFRS